MYLDADVVAILENNMNSDIIGFLRVSIVWNVYKVFFTTINVLFRRSIMIVKLFAVLDTASGVYDGPVPAQTETLANRNFQDMIQNPKSPMNKHPEDFSLWLVGTWNDATGEIVPPEHGKVKICSAVDLITGDN
jgi:hypothetical protein